MSHVESRPRDESNRAAFRQAVRKTSWVSSSAAPALTPAVPTVGAAAHPARPTVLELRLEGVVDPFVAGYVEDGIALASEAGSPGLLPVHTPRGPPPGGARHTRGA